MLFHLDIRSGMPTYMQLVNQVRRATRNGVLRPGDRLPTAREVVAALAINPNTVLKAYTQLESQGLVISRPGLGTFIAQGIPAPLAPALQRQLRRGLDSWMRTALAAGLDREGMLALISLAIDENATGADVA
ncbi:MAG TPA: GntR family transcriptional regulator [Candidatus Micrarchaeaceae archaeon]|nr:GntR family transcriptional regulator [Candidatus Micrarchaeaceae archaeon]